MLIEEINNNSGFDNFISILAILKAYLHMPSINYYE